MLHEADAAIRALIERDVTNGDDIEVAFDTPTKEWAAKRNAPTINVYLFDVREDMARRRVELVPVLDEDGIVTGRKRPPRCYRLTYLVTAWTQRAEDEHRLLSAVLSTFVPLSELPHELLDGSLDEPEVSVMMSIGLPPPKERSIGELWSAMGGELKPSLELVLSVPLAATATVAAGPPVLEEPRIAIEDDEGRSSSVGGRRARRLGSTAADREVVLEETISGGHLTKGRILTVQQLDRDE